MTTSVQFNLPAPASPTLSNHSSSTSSDRIDPDASTDAFYSLLLDCPEMNSIRLENLSNRLLQVRIGRALDVEMKVLEGELRDEWRSRTRGLKAHWMSRFIPEHEEEEDDGIEGEGEKVEGERGEVKMLQPTIISDIDGRIKMEEEVDSLVEKEFNERIGEAQLIFIDRVSSREKLELEIFLGELLLEAREEEEEDEAITESIIETLKYTLVALGESSESAEEGVLLEGMTALKV